MSSDKKDKKKDKKEDGKIEIPIKETECAFGIEDSGVCFTPDVTKKLVEMSEKKGIKGNKPEEIIEKLAESVGCDSQSCLAANGEIIKAIGHDKMLKQLEERFKPEGPYDSYAWFSNVNIDNVLKQVSDAYKDKKFLHIPFGMSDFEKTNTSAATYDFVKEYNNGMRCFGVVFNTDISSRGGQHWFSVFGDFSKKPFTIEYFNSAGTAPLPSISKWMKETAAYITKTLGECKDIVVTDIVNQQDNHSCGSYSLFYIISRLEGEPYETFKHTKIGDELMHNFRKLYLFRRHKDKK